MQRVPKRSQSALESTIPGDVISFDRDPLRAFSQGLLSREDAVRALGLRDYAGLLVALGDAGLSLPLSPPEELEAQAAEFAELWNQN